MQEAQKKLGRKIRELREKKGVSQEFFAGLQRDRWFRRYGVEPAPRPPQEYDFGAPEPFVPQRHRVRSQLKTAGGLARALIRMCDARNWYKALFPLRAGRAGQVDAAPEA